jgi:hypothetical protein
MEYARCSTTPESPVQNDPEAAQWLRRAHEKTYKWGGDFGGFTADLICNDNGEVSKGQVSIRSAKEVEVRLEVATGQEGVQKWAQEQVAMMAGHRVARSFEEGDGRFSITFSEADQHPFGRQVRIHGDGLNSRYRVKDDRIQQIDRDMGRMRFTINIEEAMQTSDDKFLTTQYVVFYFSPDNQIMKVDSLTDHPVEVKGVYLPCHRRVILTEGGKAVVRLLQFKNHQLL